MKIAQEEIFGPVLVVIRYKNIDDAIRMANDSIYGLGGAVWSRDKDKAMAVAKQMRTGTVWVNDYHLLSVAAPFGGYKQSGIGREFGLEGILEYTQMKHIHVDQVGNRAGEVLVRRALRRLSSVQRRLHRAALDVVTAGPRRAGWRAPRLRLRVGLLRGHGAAPLREPPRRADASGKWDAPASVPVFADDHVRGLYAGPERGDRRGRVSAGRRLLGRDRARLALRAARSCGRVADAGAARRAQSPRAA